MVDFQKAFDLVDHDILLKKLAMYKCEESTLSWFKSYLSTRTQQESIRHSKSDREKLICGVPQGSIFGPLLFLICINALPLYFKMLLHPLTYMKMIQPFIIYNLTNKYWKRILLLQQWCT